MQVGERIKLLRKEKKLTQKDLADRLNIGLTSVSSWETGRSNPLMDKVSQMSEIFNVPVSSFFESEEPENQVIEVPALHYVKSATERLNLHSGYYISKSEYFPQLVAFDLGHDEMFPEIPVGAHVLVNTFKPLEDNDLVVVQINRDETAYYSIRRLKKIERSIILVPANPHAEVFSLKANQHSNHRIKLVGKVLEYRVNL